MPLSPSPEMCSADVRVQFRSDERRSSPFIRGKWLEIIVVALYAITVASAILHHEPWADEAQAWQLARSVPLHSLLTYNLHYEVHPILWYFLLRMLAIAGISYSGMHWVCGAVAVAATTILLFFSPFPRYLKVLLPFTYFLLFQDAVIARPYVLVPPLLYLVALRWKKGYLTVAVLLALLANLELHAAVISGGLASVYCIEQLRAGASKDPVRRRNLIFFVLIQLCSYALALWTVWPASDLSHWEITNHAKSYGVIAGQALVWAIAEPIWISVAYWILAALCFEERGSLIKLLPVLYFAAFSTIYVSFWHSGLLIPLSLSLLWMTWPASENRKRPYEKAFRAAIVVVSVVQILWSFNSLTYDHAHPYSGDLAAAKFLKPYVDQGITIAVTYIDQPDNHSYNAVGILPYFDQHQHLFVNWSEPYWWASSLNPSEDKFQALLSSHPPIIVVEMRQATADIPMNLSDPKIQSLLDSGYHVTHAFCGTVPYRFALGMTCCHLILQYAGPSTPPTPPESH